MKWPPTTIIRSGREWELTVPSPATDDSSIIEMEMELGTIFFMKQDMTSPRKVMGAPNEPGARPLAGKEQVLKDLVEGDEERLVMQDDAARPSLTEVQIRKDVAVIPANYYNLNFWTRRLDGHSNYSLPYLSVTQMIFFAYRYYLHQV